MSCSAIRSLEISGVKESGSLRADSRDFKTCPLERRVAAAWALASSCSLVVKALRKPAVEPKSQEFMETSDSDFAR
jgi:hypothetical protein